jgi:hypothetical protein
MSSVIVVGAGIAGCAAYGALRGHHVVKVFDYRTATEPSSHQAIMRLRDPAVGRLLGVDLERVVVTKEVLSGGKLRKVATIQDNNLYSLKLYGEVGRRSLMQLGDYERWIIPDANRFPISPSLDVSYQHTVFLGQYLANLRRSDEGHMIATFKTGSPVDGVKDVPFDFMVSTIPMLSMIELAGLDKYSQHFAHGTQQSIYIARYELKMDSSVHQTIYVPEPDYMTYRVTLQGRSLIFEGTENYDGKVPGTEIDELLEYFGLSHPDAQLESYHHQPYGKIAEVPDSIRRAIILSLTDNYNIYSLGRFAIWKPIRTDHLVKDLEQIQSMMMVSDERRRYESRLNQSHQ